MPRDYDKVILSEGRFIVELSNRGKRPKRNPNPLNLNRDKMKCRYRGCKDHTNRMSGFCKKHAKEHMLHTKDWLGRLIPSGHTRKNCLIYAPSHSQMIEAFIGWMSNDAERTKVVDSFILDIIKKVHGNVPDATVLQQNLNGKISEILSPDGLVRLILLLVDEHFPSNKYKGTTLDFKKYKGIALNNLPIRIAAALLIAGLACEEVNRGDAWFCKAHNRKMQYANIFMPTGYYFLRRYAGATPGEAKMALKG